MAFSAVWVLLVLLLVCLIAVCLGVVVSVVTVGCWFIVLFVYCDCLRICIV